MRSRKKSLWQDLSRSPPCHLASTPTRPFYGGSSQMPGLNPDTPSSTVAPRRWVLGLTAVGSSPPTRRPPMAPSLAPRHRRERERLSRWMLVIAGARVVVAQGIWMASWSWPVVATPGWIPTHKHLTLSNLWWLNVACHHRWPTRRVPQACRMLRVSTRSRAIIVGVGVHHRSSRSLFRPI